MDERELESYILNLPESKGKDKKSAIKAYQRTLGNDYENKPLKQDGIVGPRTLSAYNKKNNINTNTSNNNEKSKRIVTEKQDKQSNDVVSSLDNNLPEVVVTADRVEKTSNDNRSNVTTKPQTDQEIKNQILNNDLKANPNDELKMKTLELNPEDVSTTGKDNKTLSNPEPNPSKPTEFQNQFENKILLGKTPSPQPTIEVEPQERDNTPEIDFKNKGNVINKQDVIVDNPTNGNNNNSNVNNTGKPIIVDNPDRDKQVIRVEDVVDDGNGKSFTQSFLPPDYRDKRPGFFPGLGLFAREDNGNVTSNNASNNNVNNSNTSNSNSNSNFNPLRSLSNTKLGRFANRMMDRYKDRRDARNERNAYISNAAKEYSDNQIQKTGMKSVPSDLSKREVRKFARQVDKNMRSYQRNEQKSIRDENQRNRIIDRMAGKSDRLMNNYDDFRNNYVNSQNNKTSRNRMRQDYRTQKDDLMDDKTNQQVDKRIASKQEQFNNRYNNRLNRLNQQKQQFINNGVPANTSITNENANSNTIDKYKNSTAEELQMRREDAIRSYNDRYRNNPKMKLSYKNGGTIKKYQNAGYVNPLNPNDIDYSKNLSNITGYNNSMYGEPLQADTTPLTTDKPINVTDSKGNVSYNQPNYSSGLQFKSKTSTMNNGVNNNNGNNNTIGSGTGYDYDETRLKHYGDRLQHNANLLPVLYNASKAIFDKPELQRPIQNEQSQAMLSTVKNNVMNVNMDNINAGRIAAQNTIRNNARSSGSIMNNLLALNTNASRELNNEQYRVDSANSAQKNTYANALSQVGGQRQQEFQRIDEANRQHRLAMDKFRRDALESGEKAMINKGQMLNQQKQDKISLDTYINQLSSDYKVTTNPDGTMTVDYKGQKSIIPKNSTAYQAKKQVEEMTSTDKEGNRPYQSVDANKVKKQQEKQNADNAKNNKNNGGYIRRFVF